MSDKRRWRRYPPGGSIPRVGKISTGRNMPMVECMIVDVSSGGACLELTKSHNLPNQFEFIHGGNLKVCHLVWRRGMRIGVCFDEAFQKSGLSSGLSRSSASTSWLSRPRS